MFDYLIEDLFPAFEVHLIGGPSGSGKSTWALQTFVLDWQHGRQVLDKQSYPVPWAYISVDRSHRSVIRTLKRMSIEPESLRIYSAVDHRHSEIEQILEHALKLEPRPEMLLLKVCNFSFLVPLVTSMDTKT